MKLRNFFSLIFILTTAAALWIGGQFFYDLNQYFHFSKSAPVQLEDWKINERKRGKFSIEVSYQFFIENRRVGGVYLFPMPVYQNPYLAEDMIQKWRGESWDIWFDPQKPTIATLQKKFPIKGAIHLALTLGMILYFAFFKFYVRRSSFLEGNEKKE